MRGPLLVASFGCLLVVATAAGQSGPSEENRAKPGHAPAAATADSNHRAASGTLVVGTPVRCKNLTIFPVLSRTPENSDRFITLDEGLQAKTVEVVEMAASRGLVQGQAPARNSNRPIRNGRPVHPAQQRAQTAPRAPLADRDDSPANEGNYQANEVNRLIVVNRSGKPLYLMPGEVIVGGSQDRTIGEELTIAPTGKPVPIDVFCVEHGRWSGREQADSNRVFGGLRAAPTQAAAQLLAAEAGKGKFVATAGSLSKEVRKAVQSGEGQQAVWDRVAGANRKSGTKSESGAFTFNYADPKIVDRLQPYLKALTGSIASQDRVVGAVVAVNGKIESVDVFESTPLFRKLWPKLLKSDALDAFSVADEKDAAKTCSVADASAFLVKVLQAPVSETRHTKGGLVVQSRASKAGVCYSASAPGMGGGMGGGVVHSAGYSP